MAGPRQHPPVQGRGAGGAGGNPALAAAPTTVDVRVEGARATLVATTVRTTTTPVIKDGDPAHSCTGTSGAGALERATGGRWSGTWSDGLGYSVDAVRGEGRPFRVRVTAVATTFDANFNPTTTRRPVAGAVVRGRGVRVRTGANGVATIRLRRTTTALRASRRGAIRSAA